MIDAARPQLKEDPPKSRAVTSVSLVVGVSTNQNFNMKCLYGLLLSTAEDKVCFNFHPLILWPILIELQIK